MHRLNVAIVAALLAVAVALGTDAVTRTVGLGTAGRHANDAAIAAKTRQLAAFEQKLRQALAAKTPALPPMPKTPRPSSAPAQAAPPPPQRVIYRRPPPIVVVKHTHHGDDGTERGDGGGGDD